MSRVRGDVVGGGGEGGLRRRERCGGREEEAKAVVFGEMRPRRLPAGCGLDASCRATDCDPRP